MEISLNIDNDMQMTASKMSAGRDGDHNFTRFTISKPEMLDQYICRAEFRTGTIRNYLLVEDATFLLPANITKAGIMHIQLVYTDTYDEIIAKTNIARLRIDESVNAVNEANPIFQDGLAQLSDSSFSAVDIVGNNLSFFNRAGDMRGQVAVTGSGVGSIPIIANLYAMSDIQIGFTNANTFSFIGGAFLYVADRTVNGIITLEAQTITFAFAHLITLNPTTGMLSTVHKANFVNIGTNEYIIGNMFLEGSTPTISIFGMGIYKP